MDEHKPRHIGTLSPEMALLGLLYGGPGYGYDLHRKVMTDLGEVWHLSQSQAYTILKRLEARGLVSSEEVPQEKLPSRQVLCLTPSGRERFITWLDASSGSSTRAIRMEFVTRLYFLHLYFPQKLGQAIEAQRAEAQANIRRLEQALADLPAGQVFNRMSLDLRIRQLEGVLEWVEDCRQQFFEGGGASWQRSL